MSTGIHTGTFQPPHLPLPPARCEELALDAIDPDELQALGLDRNWFRVGKVGAPLMSTDLRPSPHWRFDCPAPRRTGRDRFPVWYAAENALGALCEVFAEGASLGMVTRPQRDRFHMGRTTWRRHPTLLDLRAPRVLAVYPGGKPRLDNRMSSTDDYRLTQAWADVIEECGPDLDGLLYEGRKSGSLSLALFGARTLDAMDQVGHPWSLDDPMLDRAWAAFKQLTGIDREP